MTAAVDDMAEPAAEIDGLDRLGILQDPRDGRGYLGVEVFGLTQ